MEAREKLFEYLAENGIPYSDDMGVVFDRISEKGIMKEGTSREDFISKFSLPGKSEPSLSDDQIAVDTLQESGQEGGINPEVVNHFGNSINEMFQDKNGREPTYSEQIILKDLAEDVSKRYGNDFRAGDMALLGVADKTGFDVNPLKGAYNQGPGPKIKNLYKTLTDAKVIDMPLQEFVKLPKERVQSLFEKYARGKGLVSKDELNLKGTSFGSTNRVVQYVLPEVEEEPVSRAASTFSQAFREARDRGDMDFEWEGNKYNTNLKPDFKKGNWTILQNIGKEWGGEKGHVDYPDNWYLQNEDDGKIYKLSDDRWDDVINRVSGFLRAKRGNKPQASKLYSELAKVLTESLESDATGLIKNHWKKNKTEQSQGIMDANESKPYTLSKRFRFSN